MQEISETELGALRKAGARVVKPLRKVEPTDQQQREKKALLIRENQQRNHEQMLETLKDMVAQQQTFAKVLADLIATLGQEVTVNVPEIKIPEIVLPGVSSSPEPARAFRSEVHRDARGFIEYIDNVPLPLKD